MSRLISSDRITFRDLAYIEDPTNAAWDLQGGIDPVSNLSHFLNGSHSTGLVSRFSAYETEKSRLEKLKHDLKWGYLVLIKDRPSNPVIRQDTTKEGKEQWVVIVSDPMKQSLANNFIGRASSNEPIVSKPRKHKSVQEVYKAIPNQLSEKESCWVRIEHKISYPDDEGQLKPAADVPYCLTLSDGSKINGTLNSEGSAYHSGIPQGNCHVEFETDLDDEIKATKQEIQTTLDSILENEKLEYEEIQQQLEDARYANLNFPGSNTLARYQKYKNAIRTGIWNGIKSIAVFAWDLVKGGGKVMYEASLRMNPITAPFKFKEDLQNLKATNEVLKDFVNEDLETYAALMSDKEIRTMFMRFGKDYLLAQHSLENFETGGEVAFDVVLTIFTAGFGATGSVRHVGKLKELKPLINKLKELLHRKPLRKSTDGPNNTTLSNIAILRDSRNDIKVEHTYRGDTRGPDEIFNEGFVTKGDNLNLEEFARHNRPSKFVSTSKDPEVAQRFATKFGDEDGYIYTIKPDNGVDVNAALGKNSPFPTEQEIAILGGVKPEDIKGSTFISKDGTLADYSTINPNYSSGIPDD